MVGFRLAAGCSVAMVLALVACATRAADVKPGSMAKEEHLQAARNDEKAAKEHRDEYNPAATVLRGGPAAELGLEYNPTANQVEQAQVHERHALQHRAAAAAMQLFEDVSCVGVSADDRASCPLLSADVTGATNLPTGVRLKLANPAHGDALLAMLRCHAAFGHGRHQMAVESCAPYAPGAILQKSADGLAIEILTDTPADVVPLQRHAAEQVNVSASL